MKTSFLIAILILGGLATMNTVTAVTVVEEQNVNAAENQAVLNSFGVSGVIDNYDANQSLIVINGVSYTLSGKGDLSDADLIVGQIIKYNVEQSSDEDQGRVTRIWIE
jgi:hypothetical protein